MQIINGIKNCINIDKSVHLALGNFDGLHRGHQLILKKTIAEAKQKGGVSAALIFDPHPVIALQPKHDFLLLTDIADRAEILQDLEVDYCIIEPFTDSIALLSASDFVEKYLLKHLSLASVQIGFDYSFAHLAKGNAHVMKHLGKMHGFSVNIAPIMEYKGVKVSSSAIRTLLLDGKIEKANALLNYSFFRYGSVIRGTGVGSKILYPTANLTCASHLILPRNGVYLTRVEKIDSRHYYGLTNIGPSPTLKKNESSIETYILDFDKNIYNYAMKLTFLMRLRDLKEFKTAAELKLQIEQDIENSRVIINNYKAMD